MISLIVPVFNEEENIQITYETLVSELESRDDLDFEILFTDNHSTDRTFALLKQLAARDARVKVIRFARNFGFNRSILTGYRCARGDAAIQIDCDLQDPPAVIHQFLDLWRQGHDVVVGVRERREEFALMVAGRHFFYRFLSHLSGYNHLTNAGDFRLVDRTILDQLKQIDDARPYVRGLISDLARDEAYVGFAQRRRKFGESKFPLHRLVPFALDGIVAHSTSPLRLATYGGLCISALTVLLTAIYIVARWISPDEWPAGFATTTVLILFGISLNALFLGIIGEYIARIYEQLRVRPTVVVETTLNIDQDALVVTSRAPSLSRRV